MKAMTPIKPEGTGEIGADGFMEFDPDAAQPAAGCIAAFL